MDAGIDNLFSVLEEILQTVTNINNITQNQETIMLQAPDSELFSQLASNKQKMINELNTLEDGFQEIYVRNKEKIKSKEDIKALQTLVDKIVRTKEDIAKGEYKNSRILADNKAPGVNVRPISQPGAYVAKQYAKWGKSPGCSE